MKHTRGTAGRRAGRSLALTLSAAMVLSSTGYAGKGGGQPSGQAESDQAAAGQAQSMTAGSGKIVNIGVTSSLNTLNPLLMDGMEVNRYATGLMSLPLVELDQNTGSEGVLANSVVAKDEKNFLVHIDDKAVWSDGTLVTVDDVVYTALKLYGPVIGNPAVMYYVFGDIGDDGFVKEGADHVGGTIRVDNKTVRFTAKTPISLITFNSSYTHYLMSLPEHVIGDIDEKALTSTPWFSHPDVVSGPCKVTEFDRDHYVSYEANKDYWKGTPKVERLNIRIVEGNQLYAGLKSGGTDIIQNTISTILLEDYKSVVALESVEVSYGDPITSQSVFTNTVRITNTKVHQAMLYAVDRNQLPEQLLKRNGGVTNGFLSSASPYFGSALVPVSYDPEKAKSLLAQSGQDQSKSTRFCIDSGNGTPVNAASVITAQWAAVGVKVDIQTMGISTLMSAASSSDFDALSMQYTYPPVDPYADIAQFLGGQDSQTSYTRPEVEEALSNVALTNGEDKLKELYGIADRSVQEDVPMFSAYIIKTMAAANKHLTGVKPSVYDFFNRVGQWDVS